MPTDTHYFTLKFSYQYKKIEKINNVDTEVTVETELEITKSRESVEIYTKDGEKITPSVQLVYTTFNRKVYQPNEIVADVCFDKDSSATILDNLSIFFDSKVELKCDNKDTYSGFYVFNVLPLEVPDTDLYIRFHIFSLDHQLTLKKYSRTYVAKRLCADILEGITEEKGTVLDINKLSAASESSAKQLKFPITVVTSSRDHLNYDTSKEPIQPYLVQYNESFYDFMVRTANRCGEFFFWDEGKLRLGRSCTDKDAFTDKGCTVYYTNTNTNMEEDSYKSNYYVLDDLNRAEDLKEKGDVGTMSDIKKNVDGNVFDYLSFGNDESKLNPAGTSEEYQYNNEVNQDVYRTRLYKDRFNSLYNVTVKNAAKYMTSFVSMLLNETNLYDFLKKFVITNVISTTVSKAQLDNANSLGKDNHLEPKRKIIKLNEETSSTDIENGNTAVRQVKEKDDVIYANLFTSADTTGHLTNESFYMGIRQKEESLSRQLITFNTTTPQKLRLGQTLTYNSKTYTIIQIKMKLGTNVSNFSKIDAAAEDEFKDLASSMEVVAIPADSSIVYPPLHPSGHVRRSEPQVAFVADYLDPQKRGRVRIKYPWQSAYDDEASPWIRVLTPSATPDSGCTFELEKDDEVLINYESNNIERPYVAGTLFNKNNHAPFERGDMALISKNGHGISFDDPIDFSKFIAGVFPSYNFVNQFLAIDTSDMKNSLKLTGGTTISDAYGFYKIAMSTDQRRIDIKSPFGTVNIDAFQGINICAPNGDINIKGQNINIEAGNTIKVTSGTNISKKSTYFGNSPDDVIPDIVKGVFGGVTDYLKSITQVVDLDLLRKIIQVFLRPIDGTLEIKSNQYLLLEAGHGEAVVQRDRYLNGPIPPDRNKAKLYSTKQSERNSANVGMRSIIQQIGVYTRALIDDIPTQQKKIAKLKLAFDVNRTAATNAGLIEQNQDCITSDGIITAVYNGGNPTQKDYIGADIGQLHLRPIPGVNQGGEHAGDPAGAESGFMAAIKQWVADKIKRIKDFFNSQQIELRTELGRVEADYNSRIQQLSSLAANANALAQAAYNYFDYITQLGASLLINLQPIHDIINIPQHENTNPNSKYYDQLVASVGNIANIDNIFTCLNATQQLQACALTNQQLLDAKKYIMHQWFAQCLTQINRDNSVVVNVGLNLSYTFNAAPPCSDNWDTYVNGLTLGGPLDISLKEEILSQLNGITQQYVDFFSDIYDRKRWEPGKPGQIIFSDQSQQSFYFDRNGVAQVYENEWSSEAPTLNNLKKLLNDLN